MAGVITLLDQPRTLNAQGKPTSAVIFFYLTGTTILADIYNDAALTDPAANPVLLASGEIFPDIYLDPEIIYRRRIIYGDGTIHDVDPLPSAGLAGPEFNVLNFGAKGDGTTDDSAAVAAAIAAVPVSGGQVIFPYGSYLFGSEVTVAKSNIRFTGQNARIFGNTVIRSYFNVDGGNNNSFEGFIFDGSVQLLPTYNDFNDGIKNTPIRFRNASGLTVLNNKFINLYTSFVNLYGANNVTIFNNDFSSPLQNQNLYLSFVDALTCGGQLNIIYNRFIGAVTTVNGKSPNAVSISGISGECQIVGNRAEHCGRNNEGSHRLGVFDIYSDAVNVTVKDNKALNCREQFMRVSTAQDVLIEGNVVTIATQADTGYSTLSIESGSFTGVTYAVCKRIRILNNDFTCLGNRQAFCIGATAYDWGAACEDVFIKGNVIRGYDKAFVLVGPCKNIVISDNSIRDCRAGVDQTLFPGGLSSLTSVLGTQAASKIEDIKIENNLFNLTASSPSTPISVNTNNSPAYTGTVGTYYFKDNVISGTPSGTTIAFNALFNTSTPSGIVIATGNNIQGFSTPFYLRSMIRASLIQNYAPGYTDIYLTDGSVPTLETKHNRRSNGLNAGSGTLVAGTLTVNTAEILTGDQVQVWRITPNGTLGFLSCNPANIVNNTSFRVDSSNAADTSLFGWEILR